MEAGGAYLDLRRLELAPELTARGRQRARQQPVRQLRRRRRRRRARRRPTGSDDVLRVVQTLMAAQIVTGKSLPRRRRQLLGPGPRLSPAGRKRRQVAPSRRAGSSVTPPPPRPAPARPAFVRFPRAPAGPAGTYCAQRKPRYASTVSAEFASRNDARICTALERYQPPRSTFSLPVLGPDGSVVGLAA